MKRSGKKGALTGPRQGFFSRIAARLSPGFAGPAPTLRARLYEVLNTHSETGGADTLTEQERAMLLNILSFGGLRVDDVMVPRADIVAVEQDESLHDILQTLADAGHSRVPVYRETLDDPVGMYHIKDMLPMTLKRIDAAAEPPVTTTSDALLSRERRPVLFVPPSMAVLDLFLKMQATRVHMALVIDEYGGTDGLVTIEDLVEQIVGEIEDEHDPDEGPLLVEIEKGHYVADARTPVEDINETLGQDLQLEDCDDDIETIGGLVFDMIGRIPHRGELIKHPLGYEFEIIDADARRIKKVRLKSIDQKDQSKSVKPDPFGKPDKTKREA